jgi:hypothetical protein
MVVEIKSSTIKKAVNQLNSTASELWQNGLNVDGAIIVTKKIGRGERGLFSRRESKVLFNPMTHSPYIIKVGDRNIEIQLWYENEVDKDYRRPLQQKLGGDL